MRRFLNRFRFSALALLCAAVVLASACAQKAVSVTGITLPQQAVTLQAGETYQLKPAAVPSGAKAAFTYASSDTYVATVDSAGKITGVARGTCTVTADANGQRASLTVTVSNGISSKNIAQSNASWTNTRVPVLMYHSVSTVSGNNLCMPPEKLDAQMQWLAENGYTTLSMDELYEHISAQTALPDKVVCVTFDDGYSDNYTNAFPILKQYGIKATVFMISSFIGKAGYLSAVQLKEMSDAGVEIQDHSVTHPYLSKLSYDKQLAELRDSKQAVEAITGKTVQYVAYPYGDHNANTIKAAQALGYRLAFLMEGDTAAVSDPALEVRRSYVSAKNDLDGFIKIVEAK